ncbi:MAG TPA: hypothetical protein VLY63_07455 [Anaerolineae bacterium]|nr:hypothetical protein [Anaerolineae bacterium]
MSNLLVITFDKAEQAGKVREFMRSLDRQGMLSLDDSAGVFEGAEGKIHVKDQMDRGAVAIADHGVH